MNRETVDFLITIAFLVSSGVLFAQSLTYPSLVRAYPLAITVLLGSACIVHLIGMGMRLLATRRSAAGMQQAEAITGEPQKRQLEAEEEGDTCPEAEDGTRVPWLKFAVAIGGYLVLLRPLGYLITSALLLVVFSFIIEQRTSWKHVVSAIGITAFLYVVFGLALRVPLP